MPPVQHIACLSRFKEAGDRLWTTPISFVASANCGLYCGAKVDFVDIDLLTNNICVKALEKNCLKQGSTCTAKNSCCSPFFWLFMRHEAAFCLAANMSLRLLKMPHTHWVGSTTMSTLAVATTALLPSLVSIL